MLNININVVFITMHFNFFHKFLIFNRSNSWSTGIVYSKEKMVKLIAGSNQEWYNFKQSLTEHLNCHPTRSSGQSHLKAKQYVLGKRKKHARCCETNNNIIAAAISTCKMKASALSYESMLGLMSFCGANVGDIGHGRFVNWFPCYLLKLSMKLCILCCGCQKLFMKLS